MKIKKYIFLASIFAISLPAYSYLTVDELSSPEVLVNFGYSDQTADFVQLNKSIMANKKYKSPEMVYPKKTVWRRIYEYLDPANDDGTLLQHSIQESPSVIDY